jgi:hypothetical protein
MSTRRKYRRKASHYVVAIKITLDLDEVVYHKWGGPQRAKRGDWLVDNDGEVYTIDSRVFARTYKKLRPGNYIKTTPVWAEVAQAAGKVKTKEGESRYQRGDYLVYNQKNGGDGYCMSAVKFKSMYLAAR